MVEPLPVKTLSALMVFCAALAMLVICTWMAGHSVVKPTGHPEPQPLVYQMAPAPEVWGQR